MRIAWGIFKHDAGALVRSPLAIALALAVVVLPAVFACYAVSSTENPYARTDRLKVAVVSEDAGMSVEEARQKAAAVKVDISALVKKQEESAKAAADAASKIGAEARAEGSAAQEPSASSHAENTASEGGEADAGAEGETAGEAAEAQAEQVNNGGAEGQGAAGAEGEAGGNPEDAAQAEASEAAQSPEAGEAEASGSGAAGAAAGESAEAAAKAELPDEAAGAAGAQDGGDAGAGAAESGEGASQGATSGAETAKPPATLNMGALMVQAMQGDKTFDWQFVSAEEARVGVDSGEYYAEFVFPENFTMEFLSVLSGDLERPNVVCRVNKKRVAAMPEATDMSSGTVDSIANKAFSAMASGALSRVLDGVAGGALARGGGASSALSRGLEGAEQDLKTVEADLNRAKDSITDWRSAAEGARKSLESLKTTAPALRDAVSDAEAQLANVREKSHEVSDAYGSALAGGDQGVAKLLSDAASNLKKATGEISSNQKQLEDELTRTEKSLTECERLIAALKKVDPRSSTVADLEEQAEKLSSQIDSLKKLNKAISDAATQVNDVSGGLSGDTEKAINELRRRDDTFNGETLPKLDTGLDSLALVMGALYGSLGSLDAQISQAKNLLEDLDQVLQKIEGAADSSFELIGIAGNDLASAKSDVAALANAKAVQDVVASSNVTSFNAQSYGKFMASPISTENMQAYQLGSYGTGMAPFFASLALWVGCLMLVALIKPEVDPGLFPRRRAWQAYVGRFMLLALLALLQSVAIAVGCLLLGVQVANPVALVGAGLIAAFCFMSVVFALVMTFRHVGIVVAVLLLVAQVPAGWGLFPAKLLPKSLQAIYEWLPLTYGADALRESVGGFYGAAYLQDLLWLLACGLATLALALLLRQPLLSLNRLFDRKLEQADLFATVEYGLGSEVSVDSSFARAVKRLLDDEQERSLMHMRTRKFAQRYSIVRFIGPLMALVFIAALGIVSSLLPLSSGEKLVALGVFAGAVILVLVVCLAYEYAYDNMASQLVRAGTNVGDLPGGRIAAPVIVAPDTEGFLIEPTWNEWNTDDGWIDDLEPDWGETDEGEKSFSGAGGDEDSPDEHEADEVAADDEPVDEDEPGDGAASAKGEADA